MNFYAIYASYWDRDPSELSKNVDSEDANQSIKTCCRLVASLLQKARKEGNDRLADIEGVRKIVSLFIRINY